MWLALAFGTLMTGSPARSDIPTWLVLGLQSEPLGDLVSAVRVVIKVDGSVVDEETLVPPEGPRTSFPKPWEHAISGPARDTSKVDVEVTALSKETGAPLITRLAESQFVPGQTKLLRVPLELRCAVFPPPPPGSKVPGRLSGPTCAAPATCILGVCQSPVVPVPSLEPYAPNWPTNAPDRCKPAGGGDPVLLVGTGQTGYLPLAPMQTLLAEAGPQGGHHIWIAARMKNLKQRLSRTMIEGQDPQSGVKIPPTTFVFSYTPDEGGFCKLFGLRYQLDNGGIDYKQFLGKPLDVTLTVTDPAGAIAQATAHIQVAPTLVNP